MATKGVTRHGISMVAEVGNERVELLQWRHKQVSETCRRGPNPGGPQITVRAQGVLSKQESVAPTIPNLKHMRKLRSLTGQERVTPTPPTCDRGSHSSLGFVTVVVSFADNLRCDQGTRDRASQQKATRNEAEGRVFVCVMASNAWGGERRREAGTQEEEPERGEKRRGNKRGADKEGSHQGDARETGK